MFGILGPRNRVLGIDIAGDVAKVGPSVTTFKPGDAVFGHIGKGGHAEFAIAKETGAIVHKPEALTYEQAAAAAVRRVMRARFSERFCQDPGRGSRSL